MNNKNVDLSIAYASVMRQYFHLVRMVLGETIKQGNNWMVVSDTGIDWREYDKKTNWSDFQLILPILFSLYHGIELAMKTLLVINDIHTNGHKLTGIYSAVLKIKDIPVEISSLLSKYIDQNKMPKILSELTELNNRQIDDYYDFLKYPSDKKLKNINNYWPVKYKEKGSLNVFEEIIKDILDLSRETQKYVKDKSPENYFK